MNPTLTRRAMLGTLVAAVPGLAATANRKPRQILLRSSWQTVNIGDIAHTPGMLALLEKHLPGDEITLWPNALSPAVQDLLKTRFPKLKIAATAAEQTRSLAACDFVLHGSGPGLVGREAIARAKAAKKPYGFAGVTLSDAELKNGRELLAGARFVFTRETDSLRAFRAAKIDGPHSDFGPDATFALDLRDDDAAKKLLALQKLEPRGFLCAVPRLRWTPYWEIHPETRKPDPQRSAVNEAFADRDHAKMREAIVAWVRETRQKVFLVPEMTYAVPRLKPLLYDPLPAEIKPSVAVLDRYWLTAEAASVYALATAVLSFEMHSPILAIAAGTPAIHLRQPTDTRKGQMWRDLGLDKWLFEIDETSGRDIAERIVEIGRNPAKARNQASQARALAHTKMEAMIRQIDLAMP